MINYWSEDKHKNWLEHYVEGSYNGYFLGFTKEWAAENIPPNGTHQELVCNLLDSEYNKVYTIPIYAAYEDQDCYIMNEDYSPVEYVTLMRYFYEEHHCPCHRHTDARVAGLEEDTDKFECQGNRFRIVSITPPNSDLILYSETIRPEQLEEILIKSIDLV